MSATRSILIVGVGGQGVLLSSNIVGEAALDAGYDVRKSEVHGMAKRGGVVFGHVRYGHAVHSPLIRAGEADAVVAFEWAEALRWAPYLRPGGTLVLDTAQIVPPAAHRDHHAWSRKYPEFDRRVLEGLAGDALAVDAREIARRLGSIHVANTILLGVLSVRLDLPIGAWEAAIERSVPGRTVEVNLRAFREGRALHRAPLALDERWTASAERTRYLIAIAAGWCKACDICVRVCPEDCLRLRDGGAVEVIAPDACTGCRLCEWLCPDFAITVHTRPVAARGQS